MPADLVDDAPPAILSMLVKNVSARKHVDVYGSEVFTWLPGQTLEIKEMRDVKRDEFGTPEVKIKKVLDAHGNKVRKKVSEMVVRQGGSLRHLWRWLNREDDNPLVKLTGGPKDAEREAWKIKVHAAGALARARHVVQKHLKICQDMEQAGMVPPDKPAYVFEAEQDIYLFSRSSEEKKWKVTLDGQRFNTKEECHAHIKNTPWLVRYLPVWEQYALDMKAGDQLSASNPDVIEPPAVASANPLIQGVLKMAHDSGKTLPADIVSRLESDPDALREAMEYISHAPPDDEEDDDEEDDEPALAGVESVPTLPTLPEAKPLGRKGKARA